MGRAALALVLLLAAGGAASYTRQWAVQVRGPPSLADTLARRHGFVNLGQVFEDVYHFEHSGVAKRSASPSHEHHGRLLSEKQVGLHCCSQCGVVIFPLQRGESRVARQDATRARTREPACTAAGRMHARRDSRDGRRRLSRGTYHIEHSGVAKRSASPSHEHHGRLLSEKQYHIEHSGVAKRSASPSHEHHGRLLSEKQYHIEHSGVAKRSASPSHEHHGRLLSEKQYHIEHSGVAKRSASPSHEHHGRLLSEKQVVWAKQQKARVRTKRDYQQPRPRAYPFKHDAVVRLNDPRWPQMWYLNRGPGLDMNVLPAWAQGVTGKGVVVTILDDGLEKNHPDLIQNYDPQASYDVNGNDGDPMPRYDLQDSNRHGTRCAGEVAATANNSLCVVGVAFGAGVGGVRMLDGDVTDVVEARSLSHKPQHIDIYSASWGPDDDGKTVDGPGELATRAFIEGVTRGRAGKGSIFVWASGNGGRDHDNCNCDGYTNSIWTLSISSATEAGQVPWYSEACSSTLATTYSSGSAGQKQVVTTDLHHQCTSSHTGTSASAPLAAGICALALQANSELTWRDMQHIVVRTAQPRSLHAPDWQVNGVGRNVSHSFGYGLMDAYGMVKLARTWKRVPDQQKCEVSAPHSEKLIPAKSQVILQLNVKECAGVNFLEHVQAKVTLVSSRRGDLQIHLTSPAGTRSTLLARRPHDMSRAGFQAWPFMSVHTWGEQPFGVWQLEIHNEGRILGTLARWDLVLHGTEAAPGAAGGGPAAPTRRPAPGGSTAPEWRPPPQPGQARNDVQRTTTEDDGPASSGCLALARSGLDCIECVEALYLFEGRCVLMCPEGSYQVPKEKTCVLCHYTCVTCTGPNDYQCLSCHEDATLYHESPRDSYCYPLSLLPRIASTRWTYLAAISFSLTAVLLLAVGVYLAVARPGCSVARPLAAPRYSSVKDNSALCDMSSSDSE
ncbi:furin-like protease 1 [Bacillus rossius redtenbacheri]|uniref:furin-like protease 1 n=1 Tax=Bacillus rossius redtenbacheri TaxID=93214 RepID=UPI002FDD17DA